MQGSSSKNQIPISVVMFGEPQFTPLRMRATHGTGWRHCRPEIKYEQRNFTICCTSFDHRLVIGVVSQGCRDLKIPNVRGQVERESDMFRTHMCTLQVSRATKAWRGLASLGLGSSHDGTVTEACLRIGSRRCVNLVLAHNSCSFVALT